MATKASRDRTVGFYEIVGDAPGGPTRVPQLDWATALSELFKLQHKPAKRRWVGPEYELVGQTYTWAEQDHLLLHRVKDRAEWLSVIDWTTGSVEELESQANRGYLDTSAIVFLPYGNIVGLMQGSVAAPSHKALEGWLRNMDFFTTPLLVRPLLSRAEIERLQAADGVSRLDIRIGRSRGAALAEKGGRLARMLRVARAQYGDVDVTVTISIPRQNSPERDTQRRRLLEDLRSIEDVVPGAAEMAKAKLFYADGDGGGRTRLTELVEHHITAKRRVQVVDDKDQAVRISSAVNGILNAAEQHEDELRLAAEVA